MPSDVLLNKAAVIERCLVKRLGVPQESRDDFAMICDAGVIGARLRDRMQAMVGFRNIAVHDYRKLNLDNVRHIIEKHLEDFRGFVAAVL